jgi:hypothetical protein
MRKRFSLFFDIHHFFGKNATTQKFSNSSRNRAANGDEFARLIYDRRDEICGARLVRLVKGCVFGGRRKVRRRAGLLKV